LFAIIFAALRRKYAGRNEDQNENTESTLRRDRCTAGMLGMVESLKAADTLLGDWTMVTFHPVSNADDSTVLGSRGSSCYTNDFGRVGWR